MEDPKSGAIWAFALPMLVVIIVSIIMNLASALASYVPADTNVP